MEKIFVGDRMAGVVDGEEFITHRKPQHVMQRYYGFGISETVLCRLFMMNVKKVKILYHMGDGTKTLSCPLSVFMNSKKTHIFGTDFQRFVTMTEMTGWEGMTKNKQMNLFGDKK